MNASISTPKKNDAPSKDVLAKNAQFLACCFQCIKGTANVDFDMLAEMMGLKNAKVAATRLSQIRKQMDVATGSSASSAKIKSINSGNPADKVVKIRNSAKSASASPTKSRKGNLKKASPDMEVANEFLEESSMGYPTPVVPDDDRNGNDDMRGT